MTIDERLEFLLQSTESLHASMAEMHTSIGGMQSSISGLKAAISELHAVAREHTKQLAQDAENIRSLARIAEIHEHRLSDLEGDEPE